MRSSLSLLISAGVALAGNIQLPGLTVPAEFAAHKQDVVDIFTESYNAYRKFAFGHDQLNPLSRTPTDPRNGWGASIIDGMSTMVIMGLDDFFQEALNHTATVNFNNSNTPDTVSFFETTIRYLGGMLSAFELDQQLNGQQHPFLVEQSRQLGNRLTLAFSSGSKIPFTDLEFDNNTADFDETVGIATAGTDTLEFFTLAQHTGNDSYRTLAEGGVLAIIDSPKPLPGLPAQIYNGTTAQPVDAFVTWGGGSDSYFEYLIKYARLSNTDDEAFANSWRTAVDTSIKVLLRNSTVGNHVYLADFDDDRKIRHEGSHLACFYGGNWIMGGKLTNNDTIFNIGLQLTDACWNTYASTATGIGPESFAFISNEPNGSFTGGDPPTAEQLAFYNKHGFYITGADYIERPEVLESQFYAWRATGDTKYLDRAVSAVASFNKFLQTRTGFAGINDVNNATTTKIDDMESFWFAEVLKYLYLMFDDPSHISLDEWVFNTEAHPFKAPPAKAVYGTGFQPEPSTPFTKHAGPVVTPAVSPIAALPQVTHP
ncbi:unnamed protein product [Peniophora sp. CBMAI 1063]|nr:unnamed protein product [Peniophora sp. CBMAI 1063]